MSDTKALTAALAPEEHEHWATWAQALLDSEPGISEVRRERWGRLIATPYADLTDAEQEQDRVQVRNRLATLTPETRDRMLLGFVLDEFEAALPEGWDMQIDRLRGRYIVSAWDTRHMVHSASGHRHETVGIGPTLITAVRAARKGTYR